MSHTDEAHRAFWKTVKSLLGKAIFPSYHTEQVAKNYIYTIDIAIATLGNHDNLHSSIVFESTVTSCLLVLRSGEEIVFSKTSGDELCEYLLDLYILMESMRPRQPVIAVMIMGVCDDCLNALRLTRAVLHKLKAAVYLIP